MSPNDPKAPQADAPTQSAGSVLLARAGRSKTDTPILDRKGEWLPAATRAVAKQRQAR